MLPSSASSEDGPSRPPRRRPAGGIFLTPLARCGRLAAPIGLALGLSLAGADARAAPDEAEERPTARQGFGGELRIAGAVHQPAASFALAGDFSWRRAALGAGVEVNPYLGIGPGDALPGALHVFASAEHRVPIGRVTLRQRLGVGPAILLADTLGHSRGALGLFLEAAPLGIEIQTRVRRLAVVLEAFSLALSAPALRASAAGDPPLLRYQYRATIGVRF